MFRWFENRVDPYPLQKPTQPPRGFWAFIIHYSRGLLPWIILLGLTSAIIAVVEVALVGYLGALIDRMAGADPAGFWQTEGRMVLLAGLVLVVIAPLVQAVSSLVMNQTLLGNYPQRIRWQAHRWLLGQSLSYFQDEFAGRVATKVMQTALAVREVAMKIVDVLVYVIVYFSGALILAATSNLWLALPFAIWGIAYGLLLTWVVPRIGRVSEAQANARAAMTGRIVDAYTNITTVKLFSHSAREEAFARQSMDTFLQTVHAQMRLATIQNVSLAVLNALLTASVAGLGIWLWMRGTVPVGALAIAVPLALRMGNMSHWIMWEFAALFENIGTVRDGISALAVERKVLDAPDAKDLSVPKGEVTFRDISFDYGAAGNVIQHLNLTIKPGERIGLVGRSGAGKSTLVNLLLRFHDLKQGQILIDGQDIAQVTQESLRANIGVVTQDTSLLHRTIRENIAYGRPDASIEEILAAARLAEAEEFIAKLTDNQGRIGLDAQVGERGVKLSGGQRQRISIARVALKNAPVLVLDEATSALDSEVEAAIQEQLTHLMEGKTVIAIAHRLSTIAAMDRLVIMDKGRIVEQGTHAELLASGGIYARLWARQSGGFIAAEDQPDTPEAAASGH
ncbi:ABC transporter ATP-binding protein [Ketogulonicigenium vulgare]|uniref:Multidrug resistance ABC transporter ATP-binding and permease protein n=1 Tax=Ketogulonicigenium vulgare (strain WSH-001) TaxID=759362 RepID=F9Y881_KETVW|nr:ABC transporter ATP-binding protein [Ketogulonicigenium vulgare]ADO41517.1 ABC transporter related protein [Ketogulonicigenium vulgare Y25]AEM42367.1 Multidrug resistance ABC transporter ATP-binding and permease protein [Ketogulonicigenium vulgare WSH-001]ALJ79991.1 multidrug ABC transporter ATP-binding protein [Ketogulonicigenium vulgare]ANW32880.1 multidrug ABC transporter ATP-binding protein [Ketogulonicigenium vulgare]AOZ53451.1 ABC transporter related protein [Ketogulonicigenium vulgar